METVFNARIIVSEQELTIGGIDVSLSGTGISVFKHDKTRGDIVLKNLYLISTPPTKGRFDRFSRFLCIVKAITDILEEHSVHMVAIEGYSLGSKGRAVADLAELGGMIRKTLFDKKISFTEIEPPSLKKQITGKGNSQKDVMIKAVNDLLNLSLTDDNVSDAAGLGLTLANKLISSSYDVSKILDGLIEKSEDKRGANRLKRLRKKYGKNGIPEGKLNPKPKAKKEVPDITIQVVDF